jgi:serpin B
MKSKVAIIAILVMSVFLPSGFVRAQEYNDLQTVANANSAFGFELYQELKEKEGNLFFSPYSISTALAMTYAGARGQTEKEMAEVMHFPLDQEKLHPRLSEIQLKLNAIEKKGYIRLSIANSLWFQEGYRFLDDFVRLNKDCYDSELKSLDFIGRTEEARIAINTWVEEKTNDKIKDLIKPGVLSGLTRLVLCNAIYLKSPWAKQFEESQTKETPFHLTSGKSISVNMMNQTEDFRYRDFGTFSALELPYTSSGESFGAGDPEDPSMIIFLPKETEGLAQFEEEFTNSNIERWIHQLRKAPLTEVTVGIPKLKTTSEFELSEIFSAMGMPSAFSAEEADFSGMTGTKDLFISAVVHKAFVDVNEKGTEAAAATAVIMAMGIAPDKPEPKKFIADHPFIFLIRDNQTGSILFIGRISDPTQ